MPQRIQLKSKNGLANDFFVEDNFVPTSDDLNDIQDQFSWEQTIKDLGSKILSDPMGLAKDVGKEALGTFAPQDYDPSIGAPEPFDENKIQAPEAYFSKVLPDFAAIGKGAAKLTHPQLSDPSGLMNIYHGLMKPVGAAKSLIDAGVGAATAATPYEAPEVGNEAGQVLWQGLKSSVGAGDTKQPFIDTLGTGIAGMATDPAMLALPNAPGAMFLPGMLEQSYEGIKKSGLAKRLLGGEDILAPYEFNPEQQKGLAEALLGLGGTGLIGSHYLEGRGIDPNAPKLDSEAGVLRLGRYQRPGEKAPVDPTVAPDTPSTFKKLQEETVANESVKDLWDVARRLEDVVSRGKEEVVPGSGTSKLKDVSADPRFFARNASGDVSLNLEKIAKTSGSLEEFLNSASDSITHEATHEAGVRPHGIADPIVRGLDLQDLPSGELKDFAEEPYTSKAGEYLPEPTEKDFNFQTAFEALKGKTKGEIQDIIGQYLSDPNDRATLENAYQILKGERGPKADYRDFIPEEDVSLGRIEDKPKPVPIEAYHGTKRDFGEIDQNKSRHIGTHFGTLAQAEDFVKGDYEPDTGDWNPEEMAEYGNIRKALLSIENPLRTRDFGMWQPGEVLSELYDEIPPEHLMELSDLAHEYDTAHTMQLSDRARVKFNAKLREALSSKGYDSIVYENKSEGRGKDYDQPAQDSYIVFDPKEQTISPYSKTHLSEDLPPEKEAEYLKETMPKIPKKELPSFDDLINRESDKIQGELTSEISKAQPRRTVSPEDRLASDTAGEAYRSWLDKATELDKQFSEKVDQLYNLEEGTPEYEKLSEEAGKLQDQLWEAEAQSKKYGDQPLPVGKLDPKENLSEVLNFPKKNRPEPKFQKGEQVVISPPSSVKANESLARIKKNSDFSKLTPEELTELRTLVHRSFGMDFKTGRPHGDLPGLSEAEFARQGELLEKARKGGTVEHLAESRRASYKGQDVEIVSRKGNSVLVTLPDGTKKTVGFSELGKPSVSEPSEPPKSKYSDLISELEKGSENLEDITLPPEDVSVVAEPMEDFGEVTKQKKIDDIFKKHIEKIQGQDKEALQLQKDIEKAQAQEAKGKDKELAAALAEGEEGNPKASNWLETAAKEVPKIEKAQAAEEIRDQPFRDQIMYQDKLLREQEQEALRSGKAEEASKIAMERKILRAQNAEEFNKYREEQKTKIKAEKEQTNLQSKILKAQEAEDLAKSKAGLPPKKGKSSAIMDALGLPRSISTSLDLSAPLRQGLPMVTRGEARGAFVESIKSFGSKEAHDRVMKEIADNPYKETMDKSGLKFTDIGSIAEMGGREEAFPSKYAEKIPGIAGSERAYSTYLNKLRSDVFSTITEKFEKQGVNISNSPEVYKALADYINNATGRADLGKFENLAPGLNAVFWSPRLQASRLKLMYGLVDPKVPWLVRKEMFRDLTGTTIAVGVALGAMAALGGAKVNTDDPTKGDFLRPTWGNTSVDLGGSFLPWINLGSKILSGTVVEDTKGVLGGTKEERKKLNTPGFGQTEGMKKAKTTTGAIGARFLRGKLAPIPSMITDTALGKNYTGEDTNFLKSLREHMTPLGLGDAYDLWNTEDVPNDIKPFLTALGMTGAGINVRKKQVVKRKGL